ncbi:MAG: CAP domain-containing protein [Bacteroidia bacterium]|nr:CAP domain-containing protein [Bacteroidia bacterium]
MICLLFFKLSNAQLLDVNNIDQILVHRLFLKELNAQRTTLKLPLLTVDSSLNKMAKHQAEYMANNNVLSHTQPNKTKATLNKRAQLEMVNYTTIGENCLYVPYNIPFKIKNKIYTVSTYHELAIAMFLTWENSPKHYKNLKNKFFVYSGFYVGYNNYSNNIYATHVLCNPH